VTRGARSRGVENRSTHLVCSVYKTITTPMQLKESPAIYVSVDLGCRDRGMPQKIHNGPDVAAALEQMRCGRMSKEVWVYPHDAVHQIKVRHV